MTTPTTPGRELDALVAERIFGWRWMAYPAPNNPTETWLTAIFPPPAPDRIVVANRYDRIWRPSSRDAPRFVEWDTCPWWEDGEIQRGVPHYSTDIAAAWLVVEKMDFDERALVRDSSAGLWYVQRWSHKGRFMWEAEGVTAPHAICLAALEAVKE